MKVIEIPTILSVADLNIDFQDSLDWYTRSGPESADGLFKFADHNLFFECKNAPTAANPLAVSGTHVAGLEDCRHALEILAKQQSEAYTASIHDYYAFANAIAAGEQIVVIGGAPVVINNGAEAAAYLWALFEKTVTLRRRYQSTIDTLLGVARDLLPLRRLFFVTFLRRLYCGFDWSKRAASLLHGSHPPKVSSAFVGCA